MTIPLRVERVARLTGHNASVFAIEGEDEGSPYILSGSGDGWVVRWNLDDPETGRLIARVDTQIFSLLPLPGAGQVVAGNMNGGVHWVHLADPGATRNIAHHRRGVFAIRRVGEHIFTVGGDGTLTRWSIAEARTLESYQLSNQALRSLDFCPERNELAVGASDNAIYLLDASSLALRRTITAAHGNSVFAVRYTPGGDFLLSGGRDAHLRVWALDDPGGPLSEQPAHWFTINAIAFHPAGRWFATASRDKTIKIWDARSFRLRKVLDTVRDGGHINSVNCLFWSAHQNYLISGGDDRSLIVWRVEA